MKGNVLNILPNVVGTLSRIRKRITEKSSRRHQIEKILGSQKHMDPTKLIDRLFRYQRVIGNQVDWQPIDFNDKVVLEVGSGPLLGWGPIAVYLGSSKYICVEPTYNPKVLNSLKLWDKYFIYLYKQLIAIFGQRMSFSEFKHKVLSNITCYNKNFQDAELIPGFFDLALSNSVLEHVIDLDEFLKKLKFVCKSSCIHMHVIDFGNHCATPSPFTRIYKYRPEEYFRRYAHFINLKRPLELEKIFKQYNFDVQLIPYIKIEEHFPIDINYYWKRFPKEELSIEVAFIVSTRKERLL